MDLQQYFENFLATVSSFLPGVLGALAVLIIGWFIASSLGKLARKLVDRTGIQNRLGANSSVNVSKSIGKLVYYLLMIVVLMTVLELLGVYNVLDPLKDMVSKFMEFIPNVVAAAIIGFAGYIIANIASELVGLVSDGLESFSERMGLQSSIDLTKLLKQIVFLFIFIPILIAALDALKIEAISGPASEMLSTLINSIPNILAAALILVVFFIVGKYVTEILKSLLRNVGTDQLTERLGLAAVLGKSSLSNMIGNVAFFFIIFAGVMTALEKLEFGTVTELIGQLYEQSAQIFFGLVILVVGNYVSIIAQKLVSQGETSNSFVAGIARYGTLFLFLAIALRSMGIANDIINLAFGLIVGAIAVAIALSFGLGGREAAGKQMEHILSKFRK